MLATLRGTLIQTGAGWVVVEAGGVGFKVFVPEPVRADLGGAGRAAFLHTYLIVREDALTLYGFSNEEQKALFELLLTVQGVGPRLALAVLSSLSLETVKQAVAQERVEVLDAVPGVGRKTAERIVFTLKDKLAAQFPVGPLAGMEERDVEVMAALTSLGYSVIEAQTAVQSLPRGEPSSVEERIRRALGYFARP